MTYSMTGFGRCEAADGKKKICVEIKSVNHRYLDLNIRLPKQLNAFENPIRKEIKTFLKRGKVDVFINYENSSEDAVSLVYNSALAHEYAAILKQIAKDFALPEELSAFQMAKLPEVITEEEKKPDEEALWKFIKDAIDVSCKQLLESRLVEGKHLFEDLMGKLDEMEADTAAITAKAPKLVEEYKASLKEKVNELLGDSQIEESRIVAETILYADKICIDEELVRLSSHIRSMRDTLLSDADMDIGRKLDFLAQEMNREANTILSKTNDVTISNKGIALKTAIEKVREQIQNIE